MKKTLLILVSIVLIGTVNVKAGGYVRSMHCDGAIVEVGEPAIELLKECGEPALRTSGQADYDRVSKDRITKSDVDTWTYNFGDQEFMKEVVIKNGRIISIQSMGYGW